MTLDAELGQVVNGLWLQPDELLAPPLDFEDAVTGLATGDIVTIDAGEDGAWVPWLRRPPDDRPGRVVRRAERKREPIPHVADHCPRLEPIIAFELVPLFDDAEIYVPTGSTTLPKPAHEERAGELCTRCGKRRPGSFSAGLCVPCSAEQAAA